MTLKNFQRIADDGPRCGSGYSFDQRYPFGRVEPNVPSDYDS